VRFKPCSCCPNPVLEASSASKAHEALTDVAEWLGFSRNEESYLNALEAERAAIFARAKE
jgi:hypothetical protein